LSQDPSGLSTESRRIPRPRVCQVTGARPGFGHHVSHSHQRTNRRFNVNIQSKRYWVPSLNRHVTLTLSARGIKTIDQRGIEAVVGELRCRGVKL